MNLCTACDRKQKRTHNILFTLLKRGGGENNTVRLVSVSVHDIYSSAFLSRTLLLCLHSVSFLSPQHHSVSLTEREKSHSAYKQGVLGQAATAGKYASQRLCKRGLADTPKNNNVKSWSTPHCQNLHLHFTTTSVGTSVRMLVKLWLRSNYLLF